MIRLIVGDDPLLREEKLNHSLQQFLGSSWEDPACCIRIATGDTSGAHHFLNTFLGEIQSISMFADKKAVVLQQAEKLTATAMKEILPVLKTHQGDMTAVLIEAEKLDLRSEFAKFFKKQDWVISCAKPKEYQIPKWIQERFQSVYNRIVAADTARFFYDMIGSDLKSLDNEMQKICEYLPDSKRIEIKELKELIVRERPFSVFELNSAFGLRNPAEFKKILQNLLDNDEHPIRIIQSIISHMYTLWQTTWHLQKGLKPKEIAAMVGVNEYIFTQVSNYEAQARKRNSSRYPSLLADLIETELKLKTGALSEPCEFEIRLLSQM
jgi:DNA polymerase III delta subunit